MTSYDFQVECRFLSKSTGQGDHLYVLTSYRPFMVPNIGGKTVIISSIYAMHLRNSVSHDSAGTLNIALHLLFEEYGGGSALPTVTTLTKCPTAVVNKLLNAGNKSGTH